MPRSFAITLKMCLLASTQLFTLRAGAQDTLLLEEQFQSEGWHSFANVWADSVRDDNFDKIRLLDSAVFRPFLQTGISFLPATKVYWVKFSVKNPTERPASLLLEVSNPLINRIRLFVQDERGVVSRSVLTGDAFPFDQREVQHRDFLFPISVPAREHLTCYVFAEKFGESMSLPATLHRQAAFIEAEQREMFLLLGYFGFMFTCAFLSGVAAFVVGRKLYLYFFLYVLSATLSQFSATGLGYQFLWPGFPGFATVSGYTFSSFGILSMLALTRRFFNTGEEFPQFDWAIAAVMAVVACFWLAFLFYPAMPPSLTTFLIPIGHVVILAYCGLVVAAPIQSYRKHRRRSSLWFLFAFGFTLVGAVIHNLEIFDVLDHSPLTKYALRGGLAIDVFILALVMANKVRQAFLENQRISRQLDQLKIEAASALLEGQQSERQRLSQELHDGVSLLLATIRMRLSNLQHQLTGKNEQELFLPILADIGRVSNDVRRFTHALSPIRVGEQSLTDAIENLVLHIEQASPSLHICCELGNFNRMALPDFANHALYQTLQELLANVLKYAHASEVEIRLDNQQGKVQLTVRDNGVGFRENESGNGIGLKNIRARATLLNGELCIKSQMGMGSRVTFSFPAA